MIITTNIEIVSPITGTNVSEWTTVDVKVYDDALRRNLQLFVLSADGKFYPQKSPTFNEKTKMFTFSARIGGIKNQANSYTLLAISNKKIWNIDTTLDDDTFSSAPVIVNRS